MTTSFDAIQSIKLMFEIYVVVICGWILMSMIRGCTNNSREERRRERQERRRREELRRVREEKRREESRCDRHDHSNEWCRTRQDIQTINETLGNLLSRAKDTDFKVNKLRRNVRDLNDIAYQVKPGSCVTCLEYFSSQTALFKHFNEFPSHQV